MKNNKLLIVFVAVIGLVFPFSLGHAEDIDIYASPKANSDNPNVLIIIDNSANWSNAAQNWANGLKQGQSELNAIKTVTGELTEKINVGLFMFTEGSGSSEDGGYVRFAMRPMSADNKTGISTLVGTDVCDESVLNPVTGGVNCIYKNFNMASEKVGSAKTDYSAAMFDAFKYFGGHTSPALAASPASNAGSPVDASHFGIDRFAGPVLTPNTNADPTAYLGANKTQYDLFLEGALSCAKNYIIFVGNGFASQDSPASLLSGVGGNTNQLFSTSGAKEVFSGITLGCSENNYANAAACTADQAANGYYCVERGICAGGAPYAETKSETACRPYLTQAECEAGLPTEAGWDAYSSYACTDVSATQDLCNTTNLTNPVLTTACIADSSVNTPSKCESVATNAPNNLTNYSGFTCTQLGTDGAGNDPDSLGCAKNSSKYDISATQVAQAGKTWQMVATRLVTPTGDKRTFDLYTSSSSKDRYLDEWARFLRTTDVSAIDGQQTVQTYTIDVFNEKPDADQTALLKSAAQAGGGKYFEARNEQAIIDAFRKIFAEIQAKSSVFASSSLPVSVNTQGTYLNQVFIGMFRPDGKAQPRWAGNLKQYQLKQFCIAFDNATPPNCLQKSLSLSDKLGQQAVSSTTGFIAPCTNSLWSSDTGAYWNYPESEAVGSCSAATSDFPSAGSSSFFSDAPDGDVVEKGGAAQKMRGTGVSGGVLVSATTRYRACVSGETPSTHACRNLKTCDGSDCASLIDFNVANTSLDANLVDWVRGKDIDDENQNNVKDAFGVVTSVIDEVRPSVHGGVIHSQPAVVDYGDGTGVVAFYGGDDGVFHAVDGGKTDGEGQELWGFIAPETFGRLNRLRINDPLIDFPGINGGTPKNYFFDGAIGVFQKDATVWIYPTMRRGGRSIYAFDVSTPTSPVLKWRRGCYTNDTTAAGDSAGSCDANWSGLGQTWSKPQIGYLQGYVDNAAVPKPVLVFGGGYDSCEDTDSQTRCTSTPRKGADIWFVDADSGAIIRKYPTDYSVPGEIFLMKDAEGYIKYSYGGDTNGNLYRINVGTVSADLSLFSNWTANTSSNDTRIAALSDNTHKRKFLFGPDVFEFLGDHFVAIGSGDREKPLLSQYACQDDISDGNTVFNNFFIVKDKPAVAQSGADVVYSDLVEIRGGTSTVLDDPDVDGWKLGLNQCEQVVNKAVTTGGQVFFGTNRPTTEVNSCTGNLGIARSCSIGVFTGDTLCTDFDFGGLPPSPVTGIVDLGDDGGLVPFCLGCGGSSTLDGDPGSLDNTADTPGDDDDKKKECLEGQGFLDGKCIPITPPPTRSRVFWYMQGE